MPMTSDQMVKLLKKNGFVPIRQKGGHLRMRNPETGKETTVPIHSKDLKKATEQAILKQAGLKSST